MCWFDFYHGYIVLHKTSSRFGFIGNSNYKGDTISLVLTASDDFFDNTGAAPVTSENGLILKSLKVLSKTQAVGIFESSESTKIGNHTFDLHMSNNDAELLISVLTPEHGPGEVKAVGNIASSGAEVATLTLKGIGTNFDSNCTVDVKGADGFKVEFIEVLNSRLINILYSIDINQEPVNATVVLHDGDYRYSVPFTIVEHRVFDNIVVDQAVTKGAVKELALFHPNATFTDYTRFTNLEDTLEQGPTFVKDTFEAKIPFRVPFDYQGDALHLVAKTHTNGGAFLELLHLDVLLEEPAYIAWYSSVMERKKSTLEKVFTVRGINAFEVEELYIKEDTDEFLILDWMSETNNLGSATFFITDDRQDGALTVVAKTRMQEVKSVVAVTNWETPVSYVPELTIPVGDRVYLPVSSPLGDFHESDTLATSNEDIEINSFSIIDEYTVVVDLSVSNNALPGVKSFKLSGTEHIYDIYVSTVESGI